MGIGRLRPVVKELAAANIAAAGTDDGIGRVLATLKADSARVRAAQAEKAAPDARK